MSVQTQIDRLSGNVAAALAAIAEKGVTVPDGSTSDALASLIASIEAGGGLKCFETTFTPATDITRSNSASHVKIQHNLGVIPTLCCITRNTMQGTIQNECYMAFGAVIGNKAVNALVYSSKSSANTMANVDGNYTGSKAYSSGGSSNITDPDKTLFGYDISATGITIAGYYGDSIARFKAGTSYNIKVMG